MGGSDCELLGDGWLVQPANAWSSLAYVLAAVHVLLRGRRRHLAAPVLAVAVVALALVGVGSFAFHGPQPSWADAAHDGSITALLLVHLLVRLRPPHRVVLAVVASLAALALVVAVPSSVLALHGSLALAVAAVELRRRRDRPAPVVAVAAVTLGGLLLGLGRSGGVLCAPDSLVQAHAGWHLLSALAAAAALVRPIGPSSDPPD